MNSVVCIKDSPVIWVMFPEKVYVLDTWFPAHGTFVQQ